MVRLVNLDEDGDSEAGPPSYPILDVLAIADDDDEERGESRANLNLNSFTAALSCYPIVSQLTTYLDLITLSELARTCRQVRGNLLQYRSILIKQTLRCQNENTTEAIDRDDSRVYDRNGYRISRLTSGKVGACASDMVGDCKKCGAIVCRNCVVKAPPAQLLKLRYRRLCRTCMKSPLEQLTVVSRVVEQDQYNGEESSPQTRIYARAPCSCEDATWICQPCSQSLRADDTTYLRGWTWRSRYSACNGMGAGLGEGNEGVQCGRTRACLASQLVLKDVECDANELAHLQAGAAKAELQGRHWNGGSYTTQEMLGLGGAIKTKAKKLIPVGAVVKEYEDERVPSKKDKDRAGRSTDSIVSSGSLSDNA